MTNKMTFSQGKMGILACMVIDLIILFLSLSDLLGLG
jgi:hypothetical protein